VTPVFTINFRRATYEQGLARARRRVVLLALWVAYGGLSVILVGLFGLNCSLMTARTAAMERRVQRLEGARAAAPDLRLDPADVELVQRVSGSASFWLEKLTRLSVVMPPDAQLASVVANPEDATAPAEQRRLVLTGSIRVAGERDRMRPVVQLVEALRRDSLFARGYQNIKLVSSRVPETEGPPSVEFVVECR
jgi:hypothetical protein